MSVFLETYKRLFDEHFKALFFVQAELHKKKVCTFNDLFEGTLLKQMGVSTSTISRVLKELEAKGVIIKEKAPFPFKTRYRLVKENPLFATYLMLVKRVGSIKDYTEAKGEAEELGRGLVYLVIDAFNDRDSEFAAFAGFLALDFVYRLVLEIPAKVAKDYLEKVELKVYS